jgi:hypothetical protein
LPHRIDLHPSAFICGLILCLAQAIGQTCDEWSPLGDPGPRRDAQMVFDAHRNVVVMFGGYQDGITATNPYAAVAETWEWDGRRWRFRTLSGPPARNNHAMVYDSARHVVVLFGGNSVTPGGTLTYSRDIWDWDGNTWTERTPPAADPQPSFVSFPALAYDAARNNILHASFLDGSIWSWNGSSWFAIPTPPVHPPTVSTVAYMAYDARRQVTVMVGANQGVWEWDGTSWTHPSTAIGGSMPGAGFPRFVYDTDRQVCVLHNGNGQPDYEWDGANWTALPVSGQPALFSSAVAYDSARHSLLVFGGANTSGVLSEQFSIRTPTGWTSRAARPHPSHGYAAGMAFDSARGVTVTFGGNATADVSPQYGNETWELRGEAWTRRIIPGPNPPAVQYTAMAFDPNRQASVLYGGQGQPVVVGTWEYDGAAWVQRSTAASPIKHVMCFDPTRNGVISAAPNRLTSLWNGTTWTTISPAAQGPDSTAAAIAFNGATNMPVIYGGQFNSTSMFQLNASSIWQSLSPQLRPSGYWGPAMAYDPTRSGLVLFAGFGGSTGTLADTYGFGRRTYLYANGNWAPIANSFNNSPTGRKYHAMVYDSLARRLVMHGGFISTQQAFSDTWKLARGPAAIEVQPADATATVSQTLRLSLVASGGGNIDYQWRRNGIELDDDARITGAYSDVLVIASILPSDAGTYDCLVSNRCGQATSNGAIVATRCVADYDDGDGAGIPDGGVDISDLLFYLGVYEAGIARADVDDGSGTGALDGGVTLDDLLYYLVRFDAGC